MSQQRWHVATPSAGSAASRQQATSLLRSASLLRPSRRFCAVLHAMLALLKRLQAG